MKSRILGLFAFVITAGWVTFTAAIASGQTCGVPGTPACPPKKKDVVVQGKGHGGSSTTTAKKKVAHTPVPGTVRKNSIGMELVYIPPGEFMMGSENGRNEKPVHRVTILNGFWMGKYEVTQGRWQAVMVTNPSFFKDCGSNCPVEQVSWEDAQEFIRKLNARNDGYEYRLPSEAQWEYACRAGTTGDYYGNVDSIAWYSGNSGGTTHPVGQKQANAFGLYDMSGNVWEWVQDWYGPYSSGEATDPTGASSGQYRVQRGGSWFNDAFFARSVFRSFNNPSARSIYFGFRVVGRRR